MKKVFEYISITLVMTFYVLSYMGFGVHTCSCDGTTDIHLLFADIELSHNECEECSHHHHECSSNHTDGCCNTTVVVLSDAQNSDSTFDFSFDSGAKDLITLYCGLERELFPDFTAFDSLQKEAPPLIHSKCSLSLFSQYRL